MTSEISCSVEEHNRADPAAAESAPATILGLLVERLAARDFDGIAACLEPGIRFRALIPGGPEERKGAAAAAGRFGDWFAEATTFELVEHRIEPVADRWLVSYRIDLDEGDGPRRVEQHLFCDLGAQLVERIDLLCSGFRPLVDPVSPGIHRYDAGTLGCGDGLAAAFRAQLHQIPVGDSLVVVARDPAAREDLPSLARLLGNRVVSVETYDDGHLEITVERGR
jgi:TusA-related sulfurtransferase